MKKLTLLLVTLLTLVFSAGAFSGMGMDSLRQAAKPPQTSAFGYSLDSLVETYLRWMFEGEVEPNRLTLLPIWEFDVEVEVGKPIVLPVVMYIGFPEDPYLEPQDFWGYVQVDGREVLNGGADNFVGPTQLDPPILLQVGEETYILAWYQAIAVVIEPLSRGEHVITLQSGNTATGEEYDNTWNITVVGRTKPSK